MRAASTLLLLLALCSARALEFSLAPIDGGTFRFKDVTGHHFGNTLTNTFTYHAAQVKIALDDSHKLYLAGTVTATGLKPNFAYQIKLAGRNSKLPNIISGSTAAPDDATNERLGYIGRWWRAYPNPANSSDADYNTNKADPSFAYSAYLIIAFFLTDENGNATLRFEGNNSFHVLWRIDQRAPAPNDGPVFTATIPATAGNFSYDSGSPTPAAQIGLYGEWEPTRALPGAMVMTPGHYACDFILTEESFHDFSIDGGNWTAALGAPIEFDIDSTVAQSWPPPGAIAYPQALSAAQLNATSNTPGKFEYTPPLGTILPAGTHTLAAQLKPDDPAVPAPPSLSVTLVVQKGTPAIYWNPPAVVRAGKALGPGVFDPTASAPGQFTSDFPSSRTLQPGSYTFTLSFLPDDQANFNTPALLVRTIEAVDGLLLTSPPFALPNPAYIRSPVQFNAGSDARGTTWSWNFGDGSPAGVGSAVQHAFAAPGDYAVTVTVSDRSGHSESESLSVKVFAVPATLDAALDSDGDGFSNALEMALGADPLSVASTPLHGRSAAGAAAYSHARCMIRISTDGAARVQFSAQLTMPQNFSAAFQTLALDLGGNVLTFTLDSRGRAQAADKRATVRVSRTKATVTIDAANFGSPLAGILAAPYAAKSAPANVTILLGENLFTATETLSIQPSSRGTAISNR